MPRRRRRRADQWSNSATSLGTGRDRRRAVRWAGGRLLPDHTLRSLFRFNPIARRIAAKPPAVALSRGVELSSDGDPLVWHDELGRLDALRIIGWARTMGRVFGTALLVANIEGLPSDLPADTVRQVVNLRVVPRHRISQIHYAIGGTRDGLPEAYTITSAEGHSAKIHWTRCFRFCGLELDADSRRHNSGFDASIFEGVWEALSNAGQGIGSLATQMTDSTQGVFKIKDLRKMISSSPEDLEVWMDEVDYSRSVLNSVLLDSEEEDFEFKSRPMKDAAEVAESLRFEVCAAADMPMHELYGKREGGLSASETEATRKWYDLVDQQERGGEIGDALAWLLDLIGRQTTAPDGIVPGDVTVSWPSLWTPSAKEASEIREKNSKTALELQKGGLLVASEARSALRDDPLFNLDQEAWDSAQGQTTTDLSPLERAQQIRLLYPTGALHEVRETADPLRELLGLPPWTEEARQQWLEAKATGDNNPNPSPPQE